MRVRPAEPMRPAVGSGMGKRRRTRQEAAFSPTDEHWRRRQGEVQSFLRSVLSDATRAQNRHVTNDTLVCNSNSDHVYSLMTAFFASYWKDLQAAFRNWWRKRHGQIFCENCGASKIQVAHDKHGARKDLLWFTIRTLPRRKLKANHILSCALTLHEQFPLWFLCGHCHANYDNTPAARAPTTQCRCSGSSSSV